jgi:hypothetical protein
LDLFVLFSVLSWFFLWILFQQTWGKPRRSSLLLGTNQAPAATVPRSHGWRSRSSCFAVWLALKN